MPASLLCYSWYMVGGPMSGRNIHCHHSGQMPASFLWYSWYMAGVCQEGIFMVIIVVKMPASLLWYSWHMVGGPMSGRNIHCTHSSKMPASSLWYSWYMAGVCQEGIFNIHCNPSSQLPASLLWYFWSMAGGPWDYCKIPNQEVPKRASITWRMIQ